MAKGSIIHMLKQLNDGHSALTEARQDNRTTGIAHSEELIEGSADISHRQLGAKGDCIIVLRDESVNCGMSVVRRKEAVTWPHIGLHLVYLPSHMLAMAGISDVGVVAQLAVLSHPIFFPGRYNVENISSTIGRILIGSYPHRGIPVVGFLRDIAYPNTRLLRNVTPPVAA